MSTSTDGNTPSRFVIVLVSVANAAIVAVVVLIIIAVIVGLTVFRRKNKARGIHRVQQSTTDNHEGNGLAVHIQSQ